MLTKTVIENLLILLGESFWISALLAQLWRLRETENKRGLSAFNQTLDAAGNIAWITYFISRHLWLPASTNGIMFVLTVTMLGYTLTNRRQFSKGLLTIALVGPLTSLLLINFPHIGGWLGVSYNTLATIPWLRHVIKTKKSSGISRHSLAFRYGAIFSTLTYAVLIVSFPLITACLLGLIYTTIVVKYYRSYRHNS